MYVLMALLGCFGFIRDTPPAVEDDFEAVEAVGEADDEAVEAVDEDDEDVSAKRLTTDVELMAVVLQHAWLRESRESSWAKWTARSGSMFRLL